MMETILKKSLLIASLICLAPHAGQQQPATGQQPNRPAQSYPVPASGAESGFEALFDGKTLNGWEGDPKYWRVEQGCLVGEVTPETILKQNSFIIPARHVTPGYFECARSAFQAAGVMPERVYHTSLLQTGVLLVGAGLGISLVPESFQRMKVLGVVYRPLALASPTIDLIAAWRRDNPSPLLARIASEIKRRSATLLASDGAII